jgi:Mn2+/Fe2+ NRAMP family transporter
VTYYLPGIFAILVLAAGWHYTFFSSAATRLAAIESQRLNARRVLMRRINGTVMFLLAIDFYVISYAKVHVVTRVYLAFGLLILMMLLLIFALADLRLTRRLREELKKREP